MDNFEELYDEIKRNKNYEKGIFDRIKNTSTIKSHIYNINRMSNDEKMQKKYKNKNDKDIINYFQKILRRQYELSQGCIKLVAFDVSRTLIEYSSSVDFELHAAEKILKELKINMLVSNEKMIKIIKSGFSKYDKIRNKKHEEMNELYVYRNIILKDLIKKYRLNIEDEQLKKIINIWMKNSVNIKLNCKNIKKIVNELKERNLIVITISDMLGNMSKYALKKVGIYNIFDAHFCSNDFKYRKNNKQNSLYRIVSDTYNLKPNRCLMIGNDIVDDIVSSRSNGWKNIYTKYNNSTDSKHSLLNVSKTDDLYKLLKEDKIRFLPRLRYTDFFGTKEAKRNDKEYNNLAYQIRSIAKKIPNRQKREEIYKSVLIDKIGNNTRLGNNLEIRYPLNIIIGENCQINDDVTILNEGNVIIGNNVMIAKGLFISTYYHNWKLGMVQDNVESWKKGNTKIGTVSIEDNCWIGPNVCIENDVYLGNNCIVAANSLVKTGYYPPYSFLAGNPAKVKKNIKNDLEYIDKSYVFGGEKNEVK